MTEGLSDHPARRATHMLCLLGCLAFAAAALWRAHDRQWNSYDDGTYLHLADRLLHGQVLNRDVQDMHPGYINFANTAALKLFGNDAVSLRYPLVFMGVAGAALAYLLLAAHGPAAATTGSVATTALSFVQFMNPTAHWYALFVMLLVVAVAQWGQTTRPRTRVLLGLLVGFVVLFRQLTGAFVAIGVLTWLLMELPPAPYPRRSLAARSVLLVMALGLLAYLVRKTDPTALLAYGLPPLAVIAWCFVHTRASNADVARLALQLSAGGAVALAPLLAYHLYHGSVRIWLDDTVFGAVSLTRLPFFDDYRYWKSMVKGAKSLAHPAGAAAVLTGVFWVVVPWLPALLGAAVAAALWRQRGSPDGAGAERSRAPLAALPVLAVFYFGVALHFQKFMYLFFALPLTVMGLLHVASAWRPAFRRAVFAAVWCVSVTAYVGLSGSIRSLLPAGFATLVRDHGIPHCGIRLTRMNADFYRKALEVIDSEVKPNESILVVPCNPELYYFSGRRNPARFYLTAIGLRSRRDVEALETQFEHAPPRLVFYNPHSTYNTEESHQLMDWVASRYEAMEPVGAHQVYRWHGGSGASRPATPPEHSPRPADERERDEP